MIEGAPPLWFDDAMPADLALVDDGDLYLHPDTYARLCQLNCLEPVWDYLDALGEGEHFIPEQLVHLRPPRARQSDLVRVLQADPESGSTCTIPGCLQGEVERCVTAFGAFWLCGFHRAQVRSWDEAVSAV